MTSMPKTVLILPALAMITPVGASASMDKAAECHFDSIPLQGRVQIVDSFPDIKVQIVESLPDIKVKVVESFPDECGKWKFVESFPDFKIQIVESFPDLKVKYVESFPGVD